MIDDGNMTEAKEHDVGGGCIEEPKMLVDEGAPDERPKNHDDGLSYLGDEQKLSNTDRFEDEELQSQPYSRLMERVPMRRVASDPTAPPYRSNIGWNQRHHQQRDRRPLKPSFPPLVTVFSSVDDDDDDEEDLLLNEESSQDEVIASRTRGSSISSLRDVSAPPDLRANPIPMRRTASTPTQPQQLQRHVISPKFFPSSNDSLDEGDDLPPPIPQRPRKLSLPMNDAENPSPQLRPYDIRRQMSLPVTTFEKKHEKTPKFGIARTDSSSSLEEETQTQKRSIISKSPRTQPRGVFRNASFRSRTPESSPMERKPDVEHHHSLPQLTIPPSVMANTDDDTAKTTSTRIQKRTTLSEYHDRMISSSSPIRPDLGMERSAPSEEQESKSIKKVQLFERRNVVYVLYLSTFAIFGSTVRSYVGRFFGYDCEFPLQINDFLTPLTKHICVTASGVSEQTGGALFVDLPANLLGCFIMGLISSQCFDHRQGGHTVWLPLPWLKETHRLQRHDAFLVALRTGFAGSITTFASWNAQMVIMLDGKFTILGTQVASVIFGYMIGMAGCISSFQFGMHVSAWLIRARNPHIVASAGTIPITTAHTTVSRDAERGEREAEISDAFPENQRPRSPPVVAYSQPQASLHIVNDCCTCIWSLRSLTQTLLVCMIGCFLVGDFVRGNRFYRSMWLTSVFSPLGVLLRWKMDRWNEGGGSVSFRCLSNWFPWGTFAANVLASVISVLTLALEQYGEEPGPWSKAFLQAIRFGFAGSLSTVSTMVKEIIQLSTDYPHHAKSYYYGIATIVAACSLSMCIYSPIIRSSYK
eukprot:scaffold154462_cov58-Attheya_sp.AAC.3